MWVSGGNQPFGCTDEEVKMANAQATGHEMLNELRAHRIARETASLYANAGLVYDIDAFNAVKEIALKEVSK
jgi:hypothetical protein